MQAVFTTTDVGRICSVSANTVVRWINKGLLHCYRVPGSKHRRVTRDELAKFLEVHGMPGIESRMETR